MQSAAAQQYEFDEAEDLDTQEIEEKESAPEVKPQEREYHVYVTDPSIKYGPAVTSNYEYARQTKQRPLFRYILLDMLRYWYFYVLCLLLCTLAVGKVYQVQQTRLMTADLNEVAENNDDLSNEWLGLLAKKEGLEKQSKIREVAITQLGMFQPRTEAEVVIRLDR